MGRESRAYWLDAGDRAAVVLRLEWDALTVRGDRRAVVPRNEFQRVGEHDGVVELDAASGRYRFQLGRAASDWAAALAAPPRPLDEKLGVGSEVSVAVRGDLPVDVLEEALVDSPRLPPWEADVVVAVVPDEDDLAGLPDWLQETGVTSPVWVIHGKGRDCLAPGDAVVRRVMRDAGYRDTSTSAVAECWSATRYSPAGH
ncbi:hypothetical protein ACGGZK_07425 [Agromyces sp. MMS24-K17]|uniref:hypothetical protein n=1 Tax=Agromyces sp. MMS24-K17 TaxID=3372850 RepID=UPI0037546BE3